MRGLIEQAWVSSGPVSWIIRTALLPASLIFSLGVRLRAFSYRLGLRRVRRLAAGVVSVGNITVGGTGKTPTALWVAEELRARGHSVAILSRGYGGNSSGPTLVGAAIGESDVPATEDWRVVGDETVLLARRLRGPVVAAHDRFAAGVVASRVYKADVLVLDDGFQHLSLARDFDLVCIRDGSIDHPVLLPAGPFREPLSALVRADAVLVTKAGIGASLDRLLAQGLQACLVFWGELRPTSLVEVDEGRWSDFPLGALSGKSVLVVTGIADREPFYKTLRDWEVRIGDFLEFPDHHAYDLNDWKQISIASQNLDLVVTTEKDLVKLERFPFARGKLVAVRVVMDIEDGSRLIDCIEATLQAKEKQLS